MTIGNKGQLLLAGRKILVVEDECLIADDLADELARAGAEVVGPAASLPQAIRLMQHRDRPDAAVLDINLCGVDVFPLAEELMAGGVPMIFLTGYGEGSIPEKYAPIARCQKPMAPADVVDRLAMLLRPVPVVA